MELLIILVLILLNGVFAMSEIAMVSSRKSRLEIASKKGNKAAKKALELSRNPGKFLSTVQIGITLIGILTGIYSGEKIADDLEYFLNHFELLKPYSDTISVALIVVILTFFSMVLGEIVPKRIGLAMPEKISRLFSFPMYGISLIAAPFIWLLTITSDFILKVFRIKASVRNRVTEEEIKAMIREGTESGAIEKIEQNIMERVFKLGDMKVSSQMTHRDKTVVLRTDYSADKIRETVNREMHSTYPVMDDKMELVGVILLKDLFTHLNDENFDISAHIKPPQYISEDLSAYEALQLFRSSKRHHAVITDEFGQMQGMITMNDLLEALVGDASDFHEDEFTFVQRSDGSWLIDGRYPLHEFLIKFDLEEFAKKYPFITISGLILQELRRIPSAGDILHWMNFEIEIVDMDGARIDKVLVTEKK